MLSDSSIDGYVDHVNADFNDGMIAAPLWRKFTDLAAQAKEANAMRADAERMKNLLDRIKRGVEDTRICCEVPHEYASSPDHPPEQECCGEPDYLHDLIDAILKSS